MKINLFRTKYRIVRDTYAGYQVDVKKWWFPFWHQKGFTNTRPTLEKAREFAKTGEAVEKGYLDDLK